MRGLDISSTASCRWLRPTACTASGAQGGRASTATRSRWCASTSSHSWPTSSGCSGIELRLKSSPASNPTDRSDRRPSSSAQAKAGTKTDRWAEGNSRIAQRVRVDHLNASIGAAVSRLLRMLRRRLARIRAQSAARPPSPENASRALPSGWRTTLPRSPRPCAPRRRPGPRPSPVQAH